MEPDQVFSGKIEERASPKMDLNHQGDKEYSFQFGQLLAKVRAVRVENCGNDTTKITINIELKSEIDITLGLAVHLKVSDDGKPQIFMSAATCLVTLAQVAYSKKMMDFEIPYTYRKQIEIRVTGLWNNPAPMYFPMVEKKLPICIDNEEIEIESRTLSGYSEFFAAYFTSEMREGQDGKYPIKDCSIADFRELLAVIHPCGKPIDNGNVESMLELARRFIMPIISHKCECFLIDRMSRNEAMIENFELAEKFNLEFARELSLTSVSDASKFREMLRSERFEALPDKMKNKIRMKYIEVDLKNNP